MANLAVYAPPVETLLRAADPWPRHILSDPELRQKADDRLVALLSLMLLYDEIPDPTMSIEDAIMEGLADETNVCTVYTSLAHLLETDPLARRLILYLPFELLPNPNFRAASSTLRDASDRFLHIYLAVWQSLLSMSDVRANFFDGDVLELQLRTEPLPRVVKAAHLIPKLHERGLLSRRQIDGLLFAAIGEPILQQSINEAIAVITDTPYEQPRETAQEPTVTSERAAWLASERERALIADAGKNIAKALDEGKLSVSECIQSATRIDNWFIHKMTVEGLEQYLYTHKEDYPLCSAFLETLYENATGDMRDKLQSTFHRLYALDIVPKETLDNLSIRPITFGASFAKKAEGLPDDIDELLKIASTIATTPEFLELIYPCVIFFGSRVKGYGYDSADIDVAVFVRPGIPHFLRDLLHISLNKLFSAKKIGGKVLEFWLDENDDELTVHDFERIDNRLGDSSMAHILFGGAWIGDDAAIRELHAKLLTDYFRTEHNKIGPHDDRKWWLEELERDTLQYRLMHKGYARFFPPQDGIQSEQRAAIDGDSMFYDSGYRRLATKLFLQTVFLPEIGK